MKLSAYGIDHLLKEEGFRRRKYKDVKGLWTIGVGHLITNRELANGYISVGNERLNINDRWTKEQVITLMHQDLKRFYDAVNTVKTINQTQFDAFVSFAFNIGVSGFNRSTAKRRAVQKRHTAVPRAMRMWRFPKQIRGRRSREANLYRMGSMQSSRIRQPKKINRQPTTTVAKKAMGDNNIYLTKEELAFALTLFN